MQNKEYVDLGSNTSFSGILGSSWFAKALNNASPLEVLAETRKRNAHIRKVRLEKVNTIDTFGLKPHLRFETQTGATLVFQRETDKEVLSYSFSIKKTELRFLWKTLGVKLEDFQDADIM